MGEVRRERLRRIGDGTDVITYISRYTRSRFARAFGPHAAFEHLPPGVACTRESRELLADCCVEFIHLLASEANDVCEKASRKTITPGDVMAAVEALGFGGYRAEMEAAMEASQAQVEKDRERSRAGNKLETSGLTEEELVRQQEELFAAARRKFLDAQSAAK